MTFRFTEPLEGNEGPDGLPIRSDGYHLITLVETHWTVKGKPLRLDNWQRELLIRILEVNPATGRLRYRQVVVSIPRQAGKSLLAAILSLYGLLHHSPAPKVLGVARGVEQAKIVYGYTHAAISGSEALRELFRQTETRGISRVDGMGSYKVLPAKPEAVQGYESTLSICDELHVMKPEIWNAIVESQTAQDEPLLVGITTAGDITSVLLKTLYERGEAALAGGDESFGFFVYESASDELSIESLTEANPAIACGRIDAATILADCRGQHPSQWKRFRLNRFIDGKADPWISPVEWNKHAGTGLEDFTDCIYAFHPSDRNAYVTIYASKKVDGRIKTAAVARLVKPSLEDLKNWVDRLDKAGRCTYVMDPRRLRALVEYIDSRRRICIRVYGDRKAEAANLVYGVILRGAVEHEMQPLLTQQYGTLVLKHDVLEDRKEDAAIASVYAIYAAETIKKRGKLAG